MARVDEGVRVVRAEPGIIYRAHLDPKAIAVWRAPEGMRGEVHTFDSRVGGVYRMALYYEDPRTGRGKTTEDADVFEARFIDLQPDVRIVEAVRFTSDDPAFADEMRITTILTPVPGGTQVRVRCDDVPPGISPEDHAVGIASSLANLAAYVERPAPLQE